MTKYNINNLIAHKDLTVKKLREFGFTNEIPDYYYNFVVISQYKYNNGSYNRETLNISFYIKDINNIKLESIMFLDESCLEINQDYQNYFEGKIDYSLLDDYVKAGVNVAESILKDYIDNKILDYKEKV